MALAERWMGQWRVVAAKRSYAAKTKTYLAVDRLQQILTIKMNNITNGAVVSYKYDGDRFMSGNAKLLTGGKRAHVRESLILTSYLAVCDC